MSAAILAGLLPFSVGVPARVLTADLALETGRNILALGYVPPRLLRALQAAHAKVTRCATVPLGLEAIEQHAFEIVAVDPELEGAFAFVKAMKVEDTDCDSAQAGMALNRDTPVFVLPFQQDREYAIILRPPLDSILETTDNLPIERAMTKLDIAALIRSGRAKA